MSEQEQSIQELDEKTEAIKQKAKYFFDKKLIAHIKTIPTGSFDAYFYSELIDETYYEIKKVDSFTEQMKEDDKLFLIDIFDIKHFEKRVLK